MNRIIFFWSVVAGVVATIISDTTKAMITMPDTNFWKLFFDLNLNYTVIFIAVNFFVLLGAAKAGKFSNDDKHNQGSLDALKDIAEQYRDSKSVNFGINKTPYNVQLPLEKTWEDWFFDLKKFPPFNENYILDYHNFGNHYLFIDLDTGNEIRVPTSDSARTEKVGDSFKKGMVLRLIPRAT